MKPKKSIFGAGTVVSIFIVVILISSAIAVPAFNIAGNPGIETNDENNPEIETNDEKKLDVFTPPEYYDITIWKLQPASYEEEVIRVSYEEAMEIKAAYEQIESNNNDLIEQAKQKNAVLRNYGVLSSDDTFENYEKEFNKWTESQNMNQLWEIVDFFLKIFKVLDWGYGFCLVFFGLITGYLHGPFDEDDSICIGIPIPYTAFLWHSIFGQGPAEGACMSFFIGMFSTLFMGLCQYIQETTAGVLLGFLSGFGYISYLPFILNIENEGRFDFNVFCMTGAMTDRIYA